MANAIRAPPLQNMVEQVYGSSPYMVAGPEGEVPDTRAYGFIMGGDGSLLAANVVYILVIAAWTLAIMTPFFMILKRLGLMRVAPGERGARAEGHPARPGGQAAGQPAAKQICGRPPSPCTGKHARASPSLAMPLPHLCAGC